ncbi:MAG: hypothetical protein N3F10_00075 [Candidatus Bathyarchaeota archaeon]|nr:hypothetical protein [Candidatus Bathyarchaeota archaeon]
MSPASVPCFNWTDENGNTARKTVIIAPIKIIWHKDCIQISWACSRGVFCRDKNCRYSHAIQEKEEDLTVTSTL